MDCNVHQNVVKAIEVLLQPSVFSQDNYKEALEYVEKIKDEHANLLTIGMDLAFDTEKYLPEGDITIPDFQLQVAIYGLKLVCHCMQYRWMKTSVEVKRSLMNVFFQKCVSIIPKYQYSSMPLLIENLAKTFSELAKKEWPHQWSTMTDELVTAANIQSSASLHGEVQFQFVMLSLTRLSEDVGQMDDSLHARRRRELRSAFVHWADVGNLFDFLSRGLSAKVTMFEQLDPSVPVETQKCVVKSVLNCLSCLESFLDTVSVKEPLVTSLLPPLYSLLSNKDFRSGAVDCLMSLVSRENQAQDLRRHLLGLLLQESPMNYIKNAIGEAASSLAEPDRVFLMKLCQLLISFGNHIVYLWTTQLVKEFDTAISNYFSFILDILEQPCLSLASLTLDLWIRVLRHEVIRHSDITGSFIPRLLVALKTKSLRCGIPSLSNSPSCAFSRIDFDSDDDFLLFQNSFRSQVILLFRRTADTWPNLIVPFVKAWVSEMANLLPTDSGLDPNSIVYLQADALSTCCEVLATQLVAEEVSAEAIANGSPGSASSSSAPLHPCITPEERSGFKESFLENFEILFSLREECLSRPLFASPILASMIAFTSFLQPSQLLGGITVNPDAPPPSFLNISPPCPLFKMVTFNFDAIFAMDKFKENLVEWRRSKCALCAHFVASAKLHGRFFASDFQALLTRCSQLVDNTLLQVEFMMMIEGMVIVNNFTPNQAERVAFLTDLIEPYNLMFRSHYENITSSNAMSAYLGLDKPISVCETSFRGAQDAAKAFVRLPVSVLRRVQLPTDPTCEDGVVRLIWTMLVKLVHFSRSFWPLWFEASPAIHPECRCLFDLPVNEKQTLLGLNPVAKPDILPENQPRKHAHATLRFILETLFQCFGMASECLEAKFYLSALSPVVAEGHIIISPVGTTLLSSGNDGRPFLTRIPLHMIKLFLRHCVRPWISNFPMSDFVAFQTAAVGPQQSPEHASLTRSLQVLFEVLQPVVSHVFSIVFESWKRCCVVLEESDENEEQEIINRELTRSLTQEFLTLISSVILQKTGKPQAKRQINSGAGDDDAMMDDDVTSSGRPITAGSAPGISQPRGVSDLGRLALSPNQRALWQPMLATCVSAMAWPDTSSCLRSCEVLRVVIPTVLEWGLISEEDAAQMFDSMLSVLSFSCYEEVRRQAVVNACVTVYELVHVTNPHVRQCLIQRAQIDPEQVDRFDALLAGASQTSRPVVTTASRGGGRPDTPGKKATVHKAKEFLSLVSGLLGKPVSKQHSRELYAQALPTLWKRPKGPKKPETDLLSTSNGNAHLHNLFTTTTS